VQLELPGDRVLLEVEDRLVLHPVLQPLRRVSLDVSGVIEASSPGVEITELIGERLEDLAGC
jgi:virulence-associated protein VagC